MGLPFGSARLIAAFVLVLAVGLAGPATSTASASTPATVTKNKKKKQQRCTLRAVLKGKRACLKLRAPCHRRAREYYLSRRLDCVKRGRRRVLVRASPGAIRGGRLLALPKSGVPSFSQAKDLFDQVVADLPGVRPKKGAIGKTSSGTSALAWLYGYRDRLSPAQREVLDAATRPSGDVVRVEVDQDGNVAGGPPPEGEPAPPPGGARAARAPRARASALKEEFEAIVRDAIPRLQKKGLVLRHHVDISVQGAPPPRGDGANSIGLWLFGFGDSCLITTFDSTNRAGTDLRRQVMLHELTHCAQFELAGSAKLVGAMPGWVLDGFAEYSAVTLIQEWVGGVPDPSYWYPYMRAPSGADLFTRTYDGLGFWAQLALKGVNAFERLGPAIRAGNSPGAYAAATAGVETYDAEWGTGLAKLAALGPRWDAPDPTAPYYPLDRHPVVDGTLLHKRLERRGAGVLALNIKTDIVGVSAPEGTRGWVRKPDGTERPLTTEMAFCTNPKGCKCPGDAARYDEIKKGTMLVGFASKASAGLVQVTGDEFDEKRCKDRNKDEDEDYDKKNNKRRSPGIELRELAATEDSKLVGRISSGACGFSGKAFTARGSGSGFRFKMRIGGAKRPGQYFIPYGSSKTFVQVGGYSSLNRPPGGGGGGAVVIKRFRVGKKVRHRISVGFSPLFNAAFNRGLSLSPGPGGLVC